MRINQYCTMLNEQRTEYVASKGYVNCPQRKSVAGSSLVADFLNNEFQADCLPEEHVWLLCLNTKLRVNGVFEISIGTADASLSSVREIYKRALMVGAINIIIAHNHPSGDTTPSENDVEMTERVRNTGNIIGISLLDHIIIGDRRYTSFKEKGFLH